MLFPPLFMLISQPVRLYSDGHSVKNPSELSLKFK